MLEPTLKLVVIANLRQRSHLLGIVDGGFFIVRQSPRVSFPPFPEELEPKFGTTLAPQRDVLLAVAVQEVIPRTREVILGSTLLRLSCTR